MAAKGSLKDDLNVIGDISKRYDEELHKRFLFWRDTSGHSQNRVAVMLGRSAAAVSQYMNKKYEGDIEALERDITSLLRREEDFRIPFIDSEFVMTSVARKGWEVLQLCHETGDSGAIIGPSGIGKTQFENEYKRKDRSTILVTADITTRSVGSVLWLISKKLGTASYNSNVKLLDKIVSMLKGSRRLLIVDEAQFLSWEAFEACRKIYDCSGIGIVYVGMERLYSQMRGGNKAYLFDQIFSRIGPRCHIKHIEKTDVKLISDNIYPGLDERCLEFLFKKATQPGKLRGMVKLLKLAVQISKTENIPVTLQLLKESNKFLSFS